MLSKTMFNGIRCRTDNELVGIRYALLLFVTVDYDIESR